MRALEPWVAAPLQTFIDRVLSPAHPADDHLRPGRGPARILPLGRCHDRSRARRRHRGLHRGVRPDHGSIAASAALVHGGSRQSCMLSAFGTPRGRWIGLVVFGSETSVGIVQLFFDQMVEELVAAAPREQPAPAVCRKTSSMSSTRASKNSLDGNANVSRQLHRARDHLQDRLLRTGPVRQDDEPAVCLRPGARGPPRPHGLAGHPDRSDPVLRLPAARAGLDLRLHHQVPALHRAGAELLQRRPGSWCSRAPTAWCSWPTARPGASTTIWRACRTCRTTCWPRAWTSGSCRWCSSTTSRICRAI